MAGKAQSKGDRDTSVSQTTFPLQGGNSQEDHIFCCGMAGFQ